MRTLLLADDSVTVQRVIALTFAEQDIRVITVADGQQAMERMAAQKPDIVLAGTTLPQVSGYDLARFMRSKPELQGVPVLLLSGAFETVDEARLKASGADGIIEKPVEPAIVIGRVKELLGLKPDAKPATAGRLITSQDGPGGKKLPVATPPRAVTSTRGTPSKWQQLRDQTGLDANTLSVEDASTRSDDYLDTLDAAFDSLDQQLSGRTSSATPSRNPSGPLGQSSGAADPRSPGRRPQNGAVAPGNPVFEVDDDWFAGGESKASADVRAGRQEIADDLSDPDLQLPGGQPPAAAIFEVDDEWFAENNKARAEKLDEQRELAAEMGIHDVDLPAREQAANPESATDLKFSLDDFRGLQDSAPPVADTAAPSGAPVAPVAPAAPYAPDTPVEDHAPAEAPPAPAGVMPTSPIVPLSAFAWPETSERLVEAGFGREGGPSVPAVEARPETSDLWRDLAPSRVVADDFAQLLAFEQGEHHEPPMAAAPEIRVVAPEITQDMLDQIAERVAERLNASLFGDQLRETMTATVRDTVRSVVSETSERLVRDEIDRIKSKK